MRSRQRKKNYQEILEGQIDEHKAHIEELIQSHKNVVSSNSKLSFENEKLKQ